MREIMMSGRSASTIEVTGVGDSMSMILTLLDDEGNPIGYAELTKHGFDRLIQAGRDVAPTGKGFGKLTVAFELSRNFAQERQTQAACDQMSFDAMRSPDAGY